MNTNSDSWSSILYSIRSASFNNINVTERRSSAVYPLHKERRQQCESVEGQLSKQVFEARDWKEGEAGVWVSYVY